ncbi:MAG: undecaprenyl-diphosphatase UppP [Patescibacteria group bacterium]|nr:undecaprenyl-diphosphatase UppP [Patescibacteria group bacterium]
MDILQAIILGIIQGITEFIPVSSDGHLIIAREIFGFKDQGLIFDIFLHLATLLAVIIYFWKDIIKIIKSINQKNSLFWKIVVGTIPAVILGYFLDNLVEGYFRSINWTALFLIINGLFFILAEKISHPQKEVKDITFKDSIWIGLAQAAAILPGISRSGSTVATGLLRSIKRDSAAKFSFILSIIAILGAGTLSLTKVFFDGEKINGSLPEIIFGAIFALIAGFLAIKFLMNFFKKHGLVPFAIYIIALGSIILIYNFVK